MVAQAVQLRVVHADGAGHAAGRGAHRQRGRGADPEVPGGAWGRQRVRDRRPGPKLPYRLVVECLNRLKDARLIGYRGSASVNDFVYQITDHGRDTARRLALRCTYFGAAPISLEDYVDAVVAQGITDRAPTPTTSLDGLRGPAPGPGGRRPARPGDRLGQGDVPVRPVGQRQDQHRPADHPVPGRAHLGPARDRRRRRDRADLRPALPRRGRRSTGSSSTACRTRSTSAGC